MASLQGSGDGAQGWQYNGDGEGGDRPRAAQEEVAGPGGLPVEYGHEAGSRLGQGEPRATHLRGDGFRVVGASTGKQPLEPGAGRGVAPEVLVEALHEPGCEA